MSKLCLRGALVAAVMLALLGASTRAGATLPGVNGRIAFESDAGGPSQIYTMRPDGSDVVQLTHGTGDDYAPSWSPDGATLVFDRITSAGVDMYAIGADGLNERRLTTTGDASVGTWSPDGARIAFTRALGPNGELDLFTMSPDGKNVVNATNDAASDDMPSWSPDGRRLAFHSWRAGGAAQIYTSNVDGTGVRQLTTDAQADNEAPDWSPDGSRIAFMSNRDGSGLYQVYVMNADGTGQTRVSSEPFDAELPSWAPDGSKLLYTSWTPAGMDIVVANPEGSGRTVAAAGLRSPFPHWQPLGGVASRPAYAFVGFFAPVDNQPTVNVANAGRAIPVKFSVGGDRGLEIFAGGSPSSQRVACDTGAPISTVDETVAANSSGLSYDAVSGRYQYVWKTEASWAGTCRQLDVALADGSSHRAAFRFK